MPMIAPFELPRRPAQQALVPLAEAAEPDAKKTGGSPTGISSFPLLVGLPKVALVSTGTARPG